MSYPNEKLHAWWVVHKVNPRERLCTPSDAGYHDSQVDDEVDEVYQEKELAASFVIEPSAELNLLVGDRDDISIPKKQK